MDLASLLGLAVGTGLAIILWMAVIGIGMMLYDDIKKRLKGE